MKRAYTSPTGGKRSSLPISTIGHRRQSSDTVFRPDQGMYVYIIIIYICIYIYIYIYYIYIMY